MEEVKSNRMRRLDSYDPLVHRVLSSVKLRCTWLKHAPERKRLGMEALEAWLHCAVCYWELRKDVFLWFKLVELRSRNRRLTRAYFRCSMSNPTMVNAACAVSSGLIQMASDVRSSP